MLVFSIVSLIASAAASLFSGMTNYQNEKTAEQAAKYNEEIAKQNAQLSRAQGAFAEDKQRQEARRVQSNLRASATQSGVASGTFYDVASQSMLGAEIDSLTTRYNYEVQATDYLNQANMYNYQARSHRRGATNSLIGGFLGSGASTLNQAYSYYGGSLNSMKGDE